MNWRKFFKDICFVYCAMFTGSTLYYYLRGHELDIEWIAILSTAPLFALFYRYLVDGELWSKPAEEVEHG